MAAKISKKVMAKAGAIKKGTVKKVARKKVAMRKVARKKIVMKKIAIQSVMKKKVAHEPAKKGKGKKPPAGVDELNKWIDKHLAPRYLTIADIKRMKSGEKLKILTLDRNWGDSCMDTDRNPEFKSIRPEKFFGPSWAVYTHGAGLKGTLKFEWMDAGEAPDDFVFDLEFKKGSWYPLVEDKRTGTPTLPKCAFTKPCGGKAWDSFAKSTHVGWRGPMVAWSHLAKLPPLWWEEPDYSAMWAEMLG